MPDSRANGTLPGLPADRPAGASLPWPRTSMPPAARGPVPATTAPTSRNHPSWTIKIAIGLGILIVAGWVTLAPVFFAEMWHTVTQLLDAPMGVKWAWTVPAASELSFTLLFLTAVLLELLRRPSKWLWHAPYPFMGASLALNIAGGHGNVAAAIGHATVSAAFFVPMAGAKAVLRRLILTEAERRKAAAIADARAHAKDILRAAFGLRSWKVPALVRRQLRTGRLPAAVLNAIDEGVKSGDPAAWEPVVHQWIIDSVTLPDKVAKSLQAARDANSQSDSGSSSGSHSERASRDHSGDTSEDRTGGTFEDRGEGTSGDRGGGTSGGSSGGASGGTSRRRRGRGSRQRRPSNDELAMLITPMVATGKVTKKYHVIQAVREKAGAGIGDETAGKVLALAQAKAGVPTTGS